MEQIKSVAKAIVAGATAFGASFATAITDDVVTTNEWVLIAVGTVIAIAAVWGTPNGSVASSE